jgi:hypothetical protein
MDWIRLAQDKGCCEYGMEILGSIRAGNFFSV